MIPLLMIVLPIVLLALAALNNKTDSPETQKKLQEMIMKLQAMDRKP